MASRNELNLRARMCNIAAASYPNDSKLEQAVLYAEKNASASGAATVLAVTNAATKNDLAGVAGDKNI
jgi:hypothetical protein